MTLTHLGQTSALAASPDEAKLDYVPNPRTGKPYLVRFTAPEFTSLCPVHRPARFRASGDRLCAG
jgi:7-cyano-7-deazaguanine reductase